MKILTHDLEFQSHAFFLIINEILRFFVSSHLSRYRYGCLTSKKKQKKLKFPEVKKNSLLNVFFCQICAIKSEACRHLN